MILTAPRRLLTLAALCLVALGVLLQWVFGFRVSEAQGNVTEWCAYVLYAGAIILLLAPLGRRHALLVGALAFILMAWAVHLNARYSTHLDTAFGGDYAWSRSRVLAATLVIGPVAGVIVGVVTGLLARFERIRWTPRQPAP